MTSVNKKLFYIYAPFALQVFFPLIFIVSDGIAQKEGSLHQELEINNLHKQKTISLFDVQDRLHPKINKSHKHPTRINSLELIKANANSYLDRNKSIFGFNNLNHDLWIREISKSPAGTHLIYQAIIDGIPIYDTEIVVSVNKNGQVTFVSGNYRSKINFGDKEASIQPSQAIELARAYLRVSGE